MQAITIFVLLAMVTPVLAEEMTCRELLLQCGDGPPQIRNDNKVISTVGGGSISTQCVGIISGVLATYENCHGQLSWAGAAAILIHFVHANHDLMKKTGWECAQAAFQSVFACQKH